MGTKTKTKTTRTPYDATAVAGANAALKDASNTAQKTIAQYSPVMNQAIAQIGQNIAHPAAYNTDARAMLDKTINGDFIGQNPHTEGMAKLIADRTQGNYNASFGASGRAHGGLAALLSSQGVGDALGSFYSGIYDQERGRQQQAIGMAPGFHQDEYTDINALFPAVNNTAMMPLNAANAYGSGVTTVNSPYTTDTTTQKSGGLGQVLSTGLGLASMVGGAFMPGLGMAGMLGGAGGGLAGGIAKSAVSNPLKFLG